MTGSRQRQSADVDNFLEGKLLIAMPGMADPYFEKSVIFMCAHSSEGAMGIMINKPVAGLSFHDLMEKLELQVGRDTPNFPILYGGPVETGRGFVLHSGDYESSEATLPVSEDISLTATLDILRAMADGRGPQHAIFALGYAGWTAGQIEDEIRRNGWIHCDCDPELLFEAKLDAKWSAALRKLGIDVSGLSPHAGHA
ncbi:MAG TPA: YqgE/AlgH family protein [Rhizomicrobium sp.]|jgi:putative transcriptional regulator|nr:YqgE/AlgH family protein [Rhizomicrobium sp.]